ncbi:MAG: C_GCAxxG_C_C family (seleno)protein, partial [Candidatus Thorarchaeota archaeon]
MPQKTNLKQILPSTLKRMHRYSCAEASLQALMDLWALPKEDFSWATGG